MLYNLHFLLCFFKKQRHTILLETFCNQVMHFFNLLRLLHCHKLRVMVCTCADSAFSTVRYILFYSERQSLSIERCIRKSYLFYLLWLAVHLCDEQVCARSQQSRGKKHEKKPRGWENQLVLLTRMMRMTTRCSLRQSFR